VDDEKKRDPLAGLSDEAKSYIGGLAESGRARRSDATGRTKKDYHKGTTTLSVRVPDELADKVRAQASAEGKSISAWLGKLLERELGGGE